MSTERAVLPPPTGAPVAPLPPPTIGAPAPPSTPFLPTVAAPMRPPSAPRPPVDAASLLTPAPTIDTAAPPAWKQQHKGSSMGRTVRLLMVLCLVVGAGLGIFAYTQRSTGEDETSAASPSADAPATRLPGQQAIDDARAVVGQTNGDPAAGGVVTTNGRLTFTTVSAPQHLSQAQAVPGVTGGMTIDAYKMDDAPGVLVMVLHGPSTGSLGAQDIADALATGITNQPGVVITASAQLPVQLGTAFSYDLAINGTTTKMRVLIADDTYLMVMSLMAGGVEAPAVDAIWRSVTFDGAPLV